MVLLCQLEWRLLPVFIHRRTYFNMIKDEEYEYDIAYDISLNMIKDVF